MADSKPLVERRSKKFTEILSNRMVWISAVGAFWVLLDLRVSLSINGQTIQFGGDGFSDQLKGAVIALILVSGYSAVKEYWLGASATGATQSESMTRIAEGKAPLLTEEVNAGQPLKG